MTSSLEKKVIGGLGLTALVITAVTVVCYVSSVWLVGTASRVAQSHRFISALSDLTVQLQTVRMSSRGFVFTADPDLYRAYVTAARAVDQRLDELEQIVRDDEAQRQRITEISKLAESKLANSAQLVDVRRKAGMVAAGMIVRAQYREDIDDPLLERVRTMTRDAHATLEERERHSRDSGRGMFWMLVCGSLIELVFAVSAAVLISRDIRAGKGAVNALAASESTLRSFFNSGTIMMGIVELRDDVVTHISGNAATAKLLGVDPADLVNRPVREMNVPKEIDQLWLDNYRKAAALGGPVEFEYHHRAGAAAFWLSAVVCPITQVQASGDQRFSYVIQNVTERRRADDSLRKYAADLLQTKLDLEKKSAQLDQARCAADAASEAKSAFLANMSHEIRTPMSAVLGYSELLAEPGRTDAERQEWVGVVRRNGRHLLELINDILDLSKIEAGKMTMQISPCDPAQLASDVVAMLSPRAREKKIGLRLEFDGPVPREVRTDALRLRQVLVNLIGNAIKFTEAGEVVVMIGLNISSTAGSSLTIDVRDTGIGMTVQEISRLFQPFTQADESTTRRFGGTGLGLTICRRLLDLLGGKLDVASEPSVGSTFRITLPITAGVEIAPGDVTRRSFAPAASNNCNEKLCGTVLLVEDGEDSARLISMFLARAGLEVVHARDGRAAVDLASARAFDLILMDMQMPKLDGYDAARELRQAGNATPIIALTAHAMPGDREKCIEAGCTDYLAKPIERSVLLETIRTHLKVAEPEKVSSVYAHEPEMAAVVADFVAGLPEQVNRLHELKRDKDYAELKRMIHQLKGAGGGYGFTAISSLAADVERQLKEAPSLECVAAQVDELIALLKRVQGSDVGEGKTDEAIV